MLTDQDFLSSLGAHRPAVAEALYDKYMGKVDTIICKGCGTAHAACQDDLNNGFGFAHTCPQCGYMITVQDWNIKPSTIQHRMKDPLQPGSFIEQNTHGVRALSWKQPYASLMLHGKIETRVWDTKYRGYVLICASKQRYSNRQIENISGINQFKRLCKVLEGTDAYLGKSIAIGKLVDSRPMTKADEDACFVEYREAWPVEKHDKYGNSIPAEKQLWCHIYEDVHAIEPFDWKGSQGWSTLTWEQKKKIIIL